MGVRTISTKLAVEGEAGYRQSIAACNAEIKTLKSGLAAVESEFRNNANSMEALTAKGNELEKMHTAQAAKVTELEKALANAERAQSVWTQRVEESDAKVTEYKEALANLAQTDSDTAEEQARLTAELNEWKEKNEESKAGLAASERAVQDWQQKLNYAQVALNELSDEQAKNSRYLDEAKSSADGCATSIDKYGKAVNEADKGTSTFSAVLGAGVVQDGLKKIEEYATAAGDALLSLGKDMADARSTIVKMTGATGDALDNLNESMKKVLARVDDTNIQHTAAAIGEVNTRLGSTGDELENLSYLFLEFSNNTDTEIVASIDGVVDIMKQWNVETQNAGSLLDKLTYAGQASGVSMTDLVGSLSENKAILNQLGYSLDESIALLAMLKQEGLDSSMVMTGFRTAINNITEQGGNVETELKAIIEQIATMGSESEATALAVDTFGSRAGAKLADAIRSGRFEIDDWIAAIDNADGTLLTTAAAADTMEDEFNRAINSMKAELSGYTDELYSLGLSVLPIVQKALGFIAQHANEVAAGIVGMTTAIAAYKIAIGIATIATEVFGATLAVSTMGIGLIVGAVVGVVAAVATLAVTITSADEETQNFTKSLEESKAAYDELAAGMEENTRSTEATADALKELLEVENKSEAQKAAIADMVDRLNESVPELGLAYDAASDSINMTTESLDALLDRSSRQAEYEAQVGRLSELYTEQAEINARLTEAQNALADAQATGSGNTRTLQNNIDELTAALEENQAQIATLEEESREWGEWQAASDTATQKMTSTVSGLISEMEALEKEYAEAYQAAYDNINGQIGLFQEMDGSAKKSIDDLIGALQSQVNYMSTYAENIQKAMELGVDEGLVKKLSDGSEESAQILAAIVEGGEDQIAALNEEFAKVEEGKENFSTTIAEMETDFSARMSDIERRIQRTVDELDVSIEAGEAGAATIQGYIDGAEGMRSSLVAKYRSLANAANNAYKSTLDINSPSRVFAEHGKNTMRGAIEGAESEKDDLERAYKELAEAAVEAYERGQPRGSEGEVLAAQKEQTAALAAAVASSGGGGPTYQFHIGEMNVRDDQDVERVAEELYRLTAQATRSKGGGTL